MTTPSLPHLTRREFLGTAAALTLTGCRSTPPTGTGPDAAASLTLPKPRPTRGPLRVHPENPRYFADARGRVVYLTGSHTWPNAVDQGLTDPPPRFDFDAYLEFLTRHGHNFIRLWTWESTVCDIQEGGRLMRYYASPQPWARTGPGLARDGKPQFDLTRFDPEYFERLRSRVSAARRRGIYVSVMLFEGWAMQHAQGAYEHHPFHPSNNINGIVGDRNGDRQGLEIHTLDHPATLALQETYLRQVVETLHPFDNVLYEVSNENHPASTAWQYHVIRFVRAEEQRRGPAHPIGMTFQYKGGRNQTLFDSPADWVSPNPDGGYRDDPPAADGRKVVLNDTDHLWGIGGNPDWAWKCFLRGHNVLFMDPYDGVTFGAGEPSKWEPLRRALGQTRAWGERLPLATMTPQPALASSGYCLAQTTSPQSEFLIYSPKGGPLKVDVRSARGSMRATGYDPATDRLHRLSALPAGDWVEVAAPVAGPWLLHLSLALKA